MTAKADTADVLVVGGGLMGCATAYFLAKRGAKATLVERGREPGRETTARSGAIIRAHYGVPELVSLALEANRRYSRCEEEMEASCGFVPCGYSVLVGEEDTETLRANVAMHQKLGVNVSLISPKELAGRVPGLKTHDAALAAWEPEGGYADPILTVAAYASGARRLGVDIRCQAPVVSAAREGDAWRVSLENGDTVSAGGVVLCTGNWSRPVGAMFGQYLPVTPVRAQIVVLEAPPGLTGRFPVVSDLINLAYFRTDGNQGIWVGSSDMADLAETLPKPEGYEEAADPAAIEAARHKASLRFSGLPTADKGSVQRAFAGLYETTPDWQPVMDTLDHGLHAAVGFSGHGFKLAPVVGEAMAARALGLPDPFDISLFTLARFAEGRPIRSQHTYSRARFLR